MKMPSDPRSSWGDLLTRGAVTVFGIALVVAAVGAAAGGASGDQANQPPTSQPLPQQQVHEGMVTDSHCGAKHSTSIARNASDCVRICVHGGEKFALLEGDVVYLLDGDLEQVTKIAGQRAKITGTVNGNTIQVSSVVAGD